MKTHLIAFLLITVLGFNVAAETKEKDNFLESLNYPELEVTPLASETLKAEARDEKNGRWTVHAPIQISAISTILASQNMAKDATRTYTDAETKSFEQSQLIGRAFGYGWLITTVAMSATYKPYYNGMVELKKYKGDSKKNKLARERIAERAMRRSAELGNKIKWMSFWTQLLANGVMAGSASSETASYPLIGAVLAFAPLVFEYQWMDVYQEHRSNKKKIYGPVAHMGVVVSPDGKTVTPGMNLSYSF